jgi:4-amino-4-deoxy-L-arabinose transferase-like glycosyltransferase
LGDTETQASPADTESTPSTRLTTITWDRVGLIVLLIGTAVMYLWDITINGMGNQFYAAAAQAGSTNWEALLFGSLDPHNFITVDKPPVSQWVMGLSGQIFGFNSASMLIPQALMAVAAVALLYGAVARISGPRTGLLAGTVLALTPVAALFAIGVHELWRYREKWSYRGGLAVLVGGAAGLELSTGTAVMAIGGFSGNDPVPTLSQFQDDVAQHRVAYYIVVNNRGHGPDWGNRGHADIAKWVAAAFT